MSVSVNGGTERTSSAARSGITNTSFETMRNALALSRILWLAPIHRSFVCGRYHSEEAFRESPRDRRGGASRPRSFNFLNLSYLLLPKSVCSFLIRGGPSEKKDPPPKRAIRSALPLRLLLARSRRSLVDLRRASEDVLDVLVGRQRDRGVARRGDRTLASVLQALVEGLGVARIARQLVVHTRDRVIARLSLLGGLIELGALAFLLALLVYLAYGRYCSNG